MSRKALSRTIRTTQSSNPSKPRLTKKRKQKKIFEKKAEENQRKKLVNERNQKIEVEKETYHF
jgi:primosomal protein N''